MTFEYHRENADAAHGVVAKPSFQPAPPQPSAPEPAISIDTAPSAIGTLPPAAVEKFRALVDDSDDSRAPLNILHAERAELQTERGKAWQRLDSLTRGDKFSGGLPDDHVSIVSARAQLEKVDAEIARVQKRIDAIKSVSMPKRAVVDEIERYINRVIGSSPVEMFKGKVEPRIGKGSDVESAIARTRAEIEQALAALWEIEDAPVPSSISKQRAREQIEIAAKDGAPNVWPLIESSTGELRWPSAPPAYVPAPNGGLVPVPVGRDGFSLMLWVHRDAVIEAVERRIDELSDDSIALTDNVRLERRAAAAAELLRLEREEEALIVLAESRGLAFVTPNA